MIRDPSAAVAAADPTGCRRALEAERCASQKERLTRRIDEKKAEIKDLEDQRKGLDKAIAATSQ